MQSQSSILDGKGIVFEGLSIQALQLWKHLQVPKSVECQQKASVKKNWMNENEGRTSVDYRLQ